MLVEADNPLEYIDGFILIIVEFERNYPSSDSCQTIPIERTKENRSSNPFT